VVPVVECLLEALSSNPSPTKRKNASQLKITRRLVLGPVLVPIPLERHFSFFLLFTLFIYVDLFMTFS
jgi:hypothetical protein